MKTLFVTCIYNNLYGTEFGGRPSRSEHYKFSLLSLLKMTEANFVCFTSVNDIEELKRFFFIENSISNEQLKFQEFELNQTKNIDLIFKNKNVESVKKGDRCFEIQYNKFFWFELLEHDYDYLFWIDAGLSHTGIIPDNHLIDSGSYKRYFDSDLFDNHFLDCLVKESNDKVIVIGKNNMGGNFWSHTLPRNYYTNYDSSYHIIGGLFGGEKEIFKQFINFFNEYFNKIIITEKTLYSEENIMSLIYYNHLELFQIIKFDVWLHENNLTKDYSTDYLIKNKSFYKILEEIKS
jgi:hypothetical protein